MGLLSANCLYWVLPETFSLVVREAAWPLCTLSSSVCRGPQLPSFRKGLRAQLGARTRAEEQRPRAGWGPGHPPRQAAFQEPMGSRQGGQDFRRKKRTWGTGVRVETGCVSSDVPSWVSDAAETEVGAVWAHSVPRGGFFCSPPGLGSSAGCLWPQVEAGPWGPRACGLE